MRRNHAKHPRRRSTIQDRFDIDYTNLPEYPNIDRVIVLPLKTIYKNLDAAPWADEPVVVRSLESPLMQLVADRI